MSLTARVERLASTRVDVLARGSDSSWNFDVGPSETTGFPALLPAPESNLRRRGAHPRTRPTLERWPRACPSLKEGQKR